MGFSKSVDPKTERIYIRFTEMEKEVVADRADDAGLTMSEYIRRRAIGMRVLSAADDKVINELRRLGGLVKHLHIESQGAYSNDTAAVLRAIVQAIKHIES